MRHPPPQRPLFLDAERRANAASYRSSPLGYAESGSYPHGTAYGALGLSGLEFGSGDYDTFSYDPNTGRMTGRQPAIGSQAATGSLGWYTSGELEAMQVTDNIAGSSDSQDCGYTFDALGRIAGMGNGPSGNCLWSQSYSLDPFGNLTKTAGAGTAFNATYNLHNQVVSAGGVAGEYDPDGDLLNDPTQGTAAVNEYDPDGKAETFENVAVTYDALDRPVEAGGQEFVYAPDGGKIAVMSGQTLTRADIPLPGGAEAVFTSGGLSYYRHSDWLGSARLSSSPSQTLDAAAAYAPFGEEETGAAAGYRDFTGKTQDIAHGQAGTDPNGSYDFPAREYSPTQSRWWSPDPAALAAVDPGDPASWNRYAYGCDPLGTTDPTGMANPCTIDVNIADMGAPAGLWVAGVEGRVNQIFGATPTSAGDVTQVGFVGSGANYTLRLLGNSSTGLDFGLGPLPGPAQVFAGSIATWLSGGSTGQQTLAVGTAAAHELIHTIAGITDNASHELMGVDGAIAAINGLSATGSASDLALAQDLVNTLASELAAQAPTGFSKLTQSEANQLYTICLANKLKPPAQRLNFARGASGDSGGGGFGGVQLTQLFECGSEGCGPSGWVFTVGGAVVF